MIDYTFSTGTVRALEEKILSDELLARLEASDAAEAQKLLRDHGYGGGEGSVDELINNELARTRETIRHILPQCIYKALVLPYDCHNMKVILKDAACGTDSRELLYTATSYDTEIMAACARGGEYSLLSDNIARVLNRAHDDGELKDAFSISCLCDRAFRNEIIAQLDELSGLDTLKSYFAAKADCMNYLALMRAKNIGASLEKTMQTVLSGGERDAQSFRELYGKGTDELISSAFGLTCYDGVKQMMLSDSLATAQECAQAFPQTLLEAHRYDTDTPYPSVIYFEKKNGEARAVRRIFAR